MKIGFHSLCSFVKPIYSDDLKSTVDFILGFLFSGVHCAHHQHSTTTKIKHFATHMSLPIIQWPHRVGVFNSVHNIYHTNTYTRMRAHTSIENCILCILFLVFVSNISRSKPSLVSFNACVSH